MFQVKGIIGAIVLVFVLLTLLITFIIRAKKKGGIKKFLERSGIAYNALLQAHESGHFVAIDSPKKQFHLAIYSKTKKAYQSKTFAFDQIEQFEVYHDGVVVGRLNDAKNELFRVGIPVSGLVSVRLYIKGMQMPYLMKLDFVAEGNGSAMSNSTLEKNVNTWVSSFHEMMNTK